MFDEEKYTFTERVDGAVRHSLYEADGDPHDGISSSLWRKTSRWAKDEMEIGDFRRNPYTLLHNKNLPCVITSMLS